MNTLTSQSPATVVAPTTTTEQTVEMTVVTVKAPEKVQKQQQTTKVVYVVFKENREKGKPPVAYINGKVTLVTDRTHLNGHKLVVGEVYEVIVQVNEEKSVDFIQEVVSRPMRVQVFEMQDSFLVVTQEGKVANGHNLFNGKVSNFPVSYIHGGDTKILTNGKTYFSRKYAHTDRQVSVRVVENPWEYNSLEEIIKALPEAYQLAKDLEENLKKNLSKTALERFALKAKQAEAKKTHAKVRRNLAEEVAQKVGTKTTAPAEVATTTPVVEATLEVVAEAEVPTAQQAVDVAPATEAVEQPVELEVSKVVPTKAQIDEFLRTQSELNGYGKKPQPETPKFKGQTKAGRKSHLPKLVEGVAQPKRYSRKGRRQGEDSL